MPHSVSMHTIPNLSPFRPTLLVHINRIPKLLFFMLYKSTKFHSRSKMAENSPNDSPNFLKYKELQELYVKAHPHLPKDKCQVEANKLWKSMKIEKGKHFKIEINDSLYRTEITRLKAKICKKKSGMLDFLVSKKSKAQSQNSDSSNNTPVSIPEAKSSSSHDVSMDGDSGTDKEGVDPDVEVVTISDPGPAPNNDQSEQSVPDDPGPEDEVAMDIDQEEIHSREYETPAQNKLKNELAAVESKMASLNEARNLGIGEENVSRLTKQISEFREKRDALSAKLSRLKSCAQSSKKYREKSKKKLAKAIEQYPALASQISVRDGPGRPPLEDVYPDLHQVILDIATVGAAASDRRREELFRTVKTLDDLHKALNDLGYSLSRSALHLRLIPRNASARQRTTC